MKLHARQWITDRNADRLLRHLQENKLNRESQLMLIAQGASVYLLILHDVMLSLINVFICFASNAVSWISSSIGFVGNQHHRLMIVPQRWR